MARDLTALRIGRLFRDRTWTRRLIVAVVVMAATLLLPAVSVAQASYDAATFSYDQWSDHASSGNEAEGRLRRASIQRSAEPGPTPSPIYDLASTLLPQTGQLFLCSTGALTTPVP